MGTDVFNELYKIVPLFSGIKPRFMSLLRYLIFFLFPPGISTYLLKRTHFWNFWQFDLTSTFGLDLFWNTLLFLHKGFGDPFKFWPVLSSTARKPSSSLTWLLSCWIESRTLSLLEISLPHAYLHAELIFQSVKEKSPNLSAPEFSEELSLYLGAIYSLPSKTFGTYPWGKWTMVWFEISKSCKTRGIRSFLYPHQHQKCC